MFKTHRELWHQDVFQLLGMRVFKIPKITRGQRALQSCYISRCWRTEAGFEVPFSTSQSPLILSNLCWIYLNAAEVSRGASGCCALPAAPGELAGHKARWGVMSEGPAFTLGGWETRTQEGGRMAAGCGQPFSAPIQSSGCATPTASFPSFPLPVKFQIFLNRYLGLRIHRKYLLLFSVTTRSPTPLPSKMAYRMANNQNSAFPPYLACLTVSVSWSFSPQSFPCLWTTSLYKFSLLSLSVSLFLSFSLLSRFHCFLRSSTLLPPRPSSLSPAPGSALAAPPQRRVSSFPGLPARRCSSAHLP